MLTQEVIMEADITIVVSALEEVAILGFHHIILNMAKYMIEKQGYYMFERKDSKILITLKN